MGCTRSRGSRGFQCLASSPRPGEPGRYVAQGAFNMSEKSSSRKRQRWTTGAVMKIPLGNGEHAYGQMLESPEYAFFGVRTREELSLDAVLDHAVIFRLWVMQSAHVESRWTKIGNAELNETLKSPVLRFNQDPLNPQDIRLTYDGCAGEIGTLEDCRNIECAAVWDPEHVEDRLRSHFEGVPCKWSLSLRPTNAT